jgi:hypothetical protein
MTRSRHKIGARAEFRKQEGRRIMDSASLSDRFPKLKTLKADLSFCTPDGIASSSRLKYLVNLDHAKSVFRFDCLNRECVHGDFDLSEALARAVAAHKTTAIGELRCPGWRSKDTIKHIYCRRILRYKLSLGW